MVLQPSTIRCIRGSAYISNGSRLLQVRKVYKTVSKIKFNLYIQISLFSHTVSRAMVTHLVQGGGNTIHDKEGMNALVTASVKYLAIRTPPDC